MHVPPTTRMCPPSMKQVHNKNVAFWVLASFPQRKAGESHPVVHLFTAERSSTVRLHVPRGASRRTLESFPVFGKYMKKSVVNIAHRSLWGHMFFISFESIPRPGIAGSNGKCMLTLRETANLFSNVGCTSWRLSPPDRRGSSTAWSSSTLGVNEDLHLSRSKCVAAVRSRLKARTVPRN